MFKNTLSGGGGDPEGIGFFRTVSGTRSGVVMDQVVTIECGFNPKSMSGKITSVQGRGDVIGAITWSPTVGGLTNYQTDYGFGCMELSVTVEGTTISFIPVPYTGVGTRTIGFTFEVEGALQD